MKWFISSVLFLLLLFSCCLSEEVDVFSMSPYEQGQYALSLPMPDALSLMDKLDQDPEQVFRYAYEVGLKEWEAFTDVTLYLSYASMHTVMQERDLMKYLPILGIDISPAPDDDYSKASFDELASLRDHILMEMMTRDEWQEVTVPVGTYQVGVDIPSGHWTLTCAPRNYCYVTVGSTLEENKKEIVYGSKGYYHVALAGTESGISDRGYPSTVDLELTDGIYVCIERAYVTFAPYTGTTSFVFK